MENVLKATFWRHQDFIDYCKKNWTKISQKTISWIIAWYRWKFQEEKVLWFAENQIKKIQKSILDYNKKNNV